MKEFGIPEVPYWPLSKTCLVFRLPSETRTAGGLFIAEEHAEPKPYGVLVAAGLAARDILEDNLIHIGDVVWFGRFAGWEKEIKRDPEGKGKQILQLKVEDILGSVDAVERVKEYDIVRVETDEGMQFQYERKAS